MGRAQLEGDTSGWGYGTIGDASGWHVVGLEWQRWRGHSWTGMAQLIGMAQLDGCAEGVGWHSWVLWDGWRRVEWDREGTAGLGGQNWRGHSWVAAQMDGESRTGGHSWIRMAELQGTQLGGGITEGDHLGRGTAG